MAFQELFVTLQHPRKDSVSHCLLSGLRCWRSAAIALAALGHWFGLGESYKDFLKTEIVFLNFNKTNKSMNLINSHHTTSEYSDLNNVKPLDHIRIYGMIHNLRITKWGGFLILRKANGLIQGVIQNETTKFVDEQKKEIMVGELSREMAVIVEGTINAAKIKDPAVVYNTFEIAIERVCVISRPTTTDVIDVNALKFGDEEALLRFKFDNRHVTLRNPRDMAILRVQAAISQGFSQYLISQGFTQIYTPKIVSEGAEGGANVFKMDYFGKQVYLAQSPQFYKQIGVGVKILAKSRINR